MNREFWHERWRANEIGFHRGEVHPALPRFWSATARAADSVLVPLCGKTLDMRWLAESGHRVSGVELERRAVEAFFREWGREWNERIRPDGLAECVGAGVHLAIGDFFAWRACTPLAAFYDRAALVALPRELRSAYLAHLARAVVPGARGLLVTFEYDPGEMDGPPFPVPERELREQPWFAVERLAADDVTARNPGLVGRGLSVLHEVVYRLQRSAEPAEPGTSVEGAPESV